MRTTRPAATTAASLATAMADVQPLRALHYDTAVVGPLADVVAPPVRRDRRRPARRADRALAVQRRRRRPAPGRAGERDPYAAARRAVRELAAAGRARPRRASRRCGRTRRTTPAPTGSTRTRRGFFCRVRIEDYGAGRVRPHERTHPGPKEDRLRLTRATRANISPIFSLYSDPAQRRLGGALAGHRAAAVGARSPTPTAPSTACGASSDPEAIAAVQAATRDAELLIADGHHRYETMQAYAAGDRRRGRAPLHPHVPGRARGPRADRVPHPSPGRRPRRRAPRGARAGAASATSRSPRCRVEQIAPPPGEGPLQLGYIDGRDGRALRLTLKDQAIADAALAGHSEAYRHLDTGVLETLLLKSALGLQRRGHRPLQRPVLRARHRGGARDGPLGRVRRRVPDAPDARSRRCATSPRRARTCRPSRRTSSPSCSPGCCSTRSP